jgi:pimeloyl-ACP methyl ester carboxylesterase
MILRRTLQWTGRIALGVVLLALFVLVSGTVYQAIAGRMDAARYPPPGRLIDVGGRRLHLYCMGEGEPAVVLEAGLGMGMGTWRTVQPSISGFTRVCSYDRAGYGWSDAGPLPRTSERITADLRSLLQHVGVDGPFVLVGHSLGGLYLRHYAASFPDDVAGMILIDSSHEDQGVPSGFIRVAARLIQASGFHRWMRPSSGDANADAVYASTKTSAATNAEFAAVSESGDQVRSARLFLETKPLLVITAGRDDTGTWHELQLDLLSRSGRSRRVVAAGSGHGVHEEQPALVISQIREMVETLRREAQN